MVSSSPYCRPNGKLSLYGHPYGAIKAGMVSTIIRIDILITMGIVSNSPCCHPYGMNLVCMVW